MPEPLEWAWMDPLSRVALYCRMGLIFSICAGAAWGMQEALYFTTANEKEAYQYYVLLTWQVKLQMLIEFLLAIFWFLRGQIYWVNPLTLIPVFLIVQDACSEDIKGWGRAGHFIMALSILLGGMMLS